MNRDFPSAFFAIETLPTDMKSDLVLKPLVSDDTDDAAFSLFVV